MSLAASPFFAFGDERVAVKSVATTQRFHQLDFLRFLGAVVVAVMHFANMTILPCRDYWNGSCMVVMFFVLSGFVLSFKYLHGEEFKPTYFLARVLRLWIPFAVVLFYTQIWWQPIGSTANIVRIAAEYWNTDNFPLAHYSPLTMSSPMIGPSWTLWPELICSMIAPVMVIIGRKSSAWLAAYSCVFFFVPNGALFAAFSIGVLMAKHIDLINRIPEWVSRVMLYAFVVIAFSPMLNGYSHFAYVIPSVMVVLAFIRLPALGSHPALRFMGKLSYPIYLVHWPLMLMVGVPIVQSRVTNSWAWIGLFLVATLLASVVMLPVEWLAINALRIDFRRLTSETKSTL